MTDYTREELQEALRAIDSIIHKCEKAQEKFPEGNSHHSLLRNRLKAMYLSKTLITEALSKKPTTTPMESPESAELLLLHLNQLHTTDLGTDRIRQNLQLASIDVVQWCKEKIESHESQITRRGKNWYILTGDCEITVNAHSYTIITAHKKSKNAFHA